MTAHGRSEAVPARDFLGHPRGLAVLLASEAWERFSYFGNAALLVLYMVKYLLEPGRIEGVLGLAAIKTVFETLFGPLEAQPFASHLFGLYAGLAYSMPVLGGLVADRLLGQRRTVIAGGMLMAAGHFLMAFEALLLVALSFLILGVGAFKPNISTQVGALYAPGDPRRERAYSIFYVGINLGAFLAPLVCGTLAVSLGWHAGYLAAGVGMLTSLGIYVGGQRSLPADTGGRQRSRPRETKALDPGERRDLIMVLGVCALVPLFWAAFDQQANTILLWTEDFTDRSLAFLPWPVEFPSAWVLALNPLMIFLLTPLTLRLWAWQARRGWEPAPTRKMAFGCLCLSFAYLVMAGAAWSTADRAGVLWLIGYFALATIGELHVAPVGLAMVARLAPARMQSATMGAWFAATLPAGILGGIVGGLWSGMRKADFFLLVAAIAAAAGAAIWLFQKVMGDARDPPPRQGA